MRFLAPFSRLASVQLPACGTSNHRAALAVPMCTRLRLAVTRPCPLALCACSSSVGEDAGQAESAEAAVVEARECTDLLSAESEDHQAVRVQAVSALTAGP